MDAEAPNEVTPYMRQMSLVHAPNRSGIAGFRELNRN